MFGYDLKQASTYFLKGKHQILKLIVLYFVMAISGALSILGNFADKFNDLSLKYLLLGFLATVVFSFYCGGYLAANVNQRIIKPENSLPRLGDFIKYFVVGFKIAVGFLLYQLSFSVLFGILILLFGAGIAVMTSNIPIGIILVLLASVLLIALSILSILFLLYLIAIQIAFSTNLKFSSMFNFKLINILLFKNFGYFAELLLMVFLFGIIFITISLVLCVTIVGIILIPALWLALSLILGDIYAQYVRKIFNIEAKIKQKSEQNEVANG